MNQRIAESFLKTFSDDKGLAVPVVPTFGNNDIYPHNILLPGPNKILKTYTDVWSNFIPEEQRHSFEFGGWFYVEVIPGRLAVFSLNTLYFFDRNAGVDDCAHPSEPGYKQFEWLRIQLQFLRDRGMKAILMGHVPPARTPGKQLWDETCWQKYTLWLQQYRDVIVGSLYGHMNIDHFLLQDTKDIDYSLMEAQSSGRPNVRVSMEEELSAESSKDYLMELREDWAKLPDVREHDNDVEEFGKKKHKKKGGKNKIGGPNAERYQLTLISPSIVPNYFPSLRVFEYNITGLEDTTTWADSIRVSEKKSPLEQDTRELELRREPTMDLEKKKKNKGKGKKGKGGKSPDFQVPDPPAKGALPGPAYLPQPLTLRGFTQYYANLTHINNMAADNLDGDDTSELGRDIGKPPKHDKPKPREFEFQVEYTTFDDKIYKLKDLTVKSVLRLAHRIGQTSDAQSEEGLVEDWDDNEHDEYDDSDNDEDQEELDSEFETDKKKKKGKGKKKHKGHKKNTKVWLHFLRHAFVSTRSKKELEDLG
ncbi:Endopolyphosphatase [Hypoxylon sp. FL1284]|nr:Endopolyphosphatase [Hypoxylon sp. FL1284]